ncbi:MAG TPA: hypothetical protein VG371_09010, partial [Solirubrobacteraceae bacterium]|nr:hypothetical protein [Solirubrobacteraceae bacterium]
MRKRIHLGSAVIALGLVSALLAIASSGAAASSQGCTKATATRLVNHYKLNDFLLPKPVAQVLCGPFTGARSEAMLVTIAAGTCWGVQQWAVFSFRAGAWHLVTDRHVWIYPPVVASAGEFSVSSPIPRAGDPYCNPSGGRITRTWRWNGSRFVIVSVKRKPAPLTSAEFYDRSLSRVIGCEMEDASTIPGGGQVLCQSFSSALDQNAKLDLSGPVLVCSQRNPGTTNPCNLGNLGDRVPTLGVGRQIT